MELQIKLVFVTLLLGLQLTDHVISAQAAAATSNTTVAPTAAPGGSTTPAPGVTAAPPVTTLASGVTSKPTTAPTVIACLDGSCTGNCSKFNNVTCSSDTSKGCKTVIDSSKTPTEYTFSCGPTPDADCKKDGASCCYKDKCNSYAAATKSKSAASTVVGNLMSLTLISLLAYYI